MTLSIDVKDKADLLDLLDGDERLTESVYGMFVINPAHRNEAAGDWMRSIQAGKILDTLDDLGLLDI